MRRPARVFEHGTLRIGQQGLTRGRFDALVRYNDRNGSRFFTVGNRCLHFSNFVGVIQVGSLAIEILPKAGHASDADAEKWQNALLHMLHHAGVLRGVPAADAHLHLRRSPLIDVYITAFLDRVEQLAHAGLAKKYRRTEGNLHKIKGRILFPQHITKNLLHRERTYTSHETYDRDNVYNRIIKRALGLISLIGVPISMAARADSLSLAFEDVSDAAATSATFERLAFDRTTERYRDAIQLARLIILNYAPDLRGGSEHIIAILFDMNRLFEAFILAELRRARTALAECGLRVEGQASKQFWGRRPLRPDILAYATHGDRSEGVQLILDTKWKVPRDGSPADDDLKQMYAYNLHFGAARSILLYPKSDAIQDGLRQPFHSSASLPEHEHECETYFVELFDAAGKLRRDIGETLIRNVIAKYS